MGNDDRTKLAQALTEPGIPVVPAATEPAISGIRQRSSSQLRAAGGRAGTRVVGALVVTAEGVVVGADPIALELLKTTSDLFVHQRRIRVRGATNPLPFFQAIRVASRTAPQSGLRSTFRFPGDPGLECVVVPAPEPSGRSTRHAVLVLAHDTFDPPRGQADG